MLDPSDISATHYPLHDQFGTIIGTLCGRAEAIYYDAIYANEGEGVTCKQCFELKLRQPIPEPKEPEVSTVHLYDYRRLAKKGSSLCKATSGTVCADPNLTSCAACIVDEAFPDEIRKKRLALMMTGPKAVDYSLKSQKVNRPIDGSTKNHRGICMATDMKSIMVRAAKRGASTGVCKLISREILEVVAEYYPAVMLLPSDLQAIVLVGIANVVAQGGASFPGAAHVEQITADAMESMVSQFTADIVENLVEKIGPKLARISGVSRKKAKAIAEDE